MCGYCERDAEIARLRKALVWAVKHDAKYRLNTRRFIDEDNGGRVAYHTAPSWKASFIECDGADESLIETLCRLAEGE